MVHTFELSKMISKDTYEEIKSILHMRRFKTCFITTAYAGKGFQCIRLYKIKNEMYNAQDDNALMHLYMISLSISTADMFEGSADPHLSQNILNFTPDYVRAIYFHIFELIPCLEQGKDHYDRNSQAWLELNSFKARRIDFAFDLKYMHQQYLALINRGYSLRKKFTSVVILIMKIHKKKYLIMNQIYPTARKS